MNPRTLNVWKGIGWVTLGHLVAYLIAVTTDTWLLVLAIGMTQLLYTLPMTVIFRNHDGMVTGVWIAFGLTFLLNSACFGIVLFGFVPLF